MLKTVITRSTYAQDEAGQMVLRQLQDAFATDEGVCYYHHPATITDAGTIPDFTLITRTSQPLLIKVISCQISEIESADEETWVIQGISLDSPLLELEDLVLKLESRLRAVRELRSLLRPHGILAFPFISQSDFESRFGALLKSAPVLWKDGPTDILLQSIRRPLSESEFTSARAIIQGATNLRKPQDGSGQPRATMGEALQELNKQMAALDDEQETFALQIAPGPQGLHGGPGTGKTTLLAMKAAHIHLQEPDKRILFTFNNPGLREPIREIIASTYRAQSGKGPNWDLIHVLHAWGSHYHDGVYRNICSVTGVRPFKLDMTGEEGYTPQECCVHALGLPIKETYDVVLVDEAQDFPQEFFQILYHLSTSPSHRVSWACDELAHFEHPARFQPEVLFGTGDDGKPRVSFADKSYPGPIEKEITLRRSYGCLPNILLLAQAIGLGLHDTQNGPSPIARDKSYWEALGYTVAQGEGHVGEEIVITCPANAGPNPVQEISHPQKLLTTHIFQDLEAEVQWVKEAIKRDINVDNVRPEQIMAIPLNPERADDYQGELAQRLVFPEKILPEMGGLFEDDTASLREGRVACPTVQRAKGSEVSVVYLLGFDAIYHETAWASVRKLAFALLTRSKVWLRLTGQGRKMELAEREIATILADLPEFRFKIPDEQELQQSRIATRRAVLVEEQLATITKLFPEQLQAESIDQLHQWLEKVIIHENTIIA